MSEAMRAMPQYQEMLSKYSLHIHLANAAMDIFNDKNIERIALLEQDMSTGEDADGKTVKNVITNLPPILSDPAVSKDEKLRLLMIYIISQEGIKEQDRKRLMDLAKISNQEQNSIANLYYLGVNLMKGAKGKRKNASKKSKKKRKEDVPYELSRYVPNVKDIMEDIVNDKLASTEFPFFREDPGVASSSKASSGSRQSASLKGAGSKQPRWADKGKKKEEPRAEFKGPRLIVFIAGGMTFSEMRSAYEITQQYQRQVFIGSTHIITPKGMLEDLTKLKKLATMSRRYESC